jgi:serine protease Do
MQTKEIINLFQPVIIQIATPQGTGTGFYIRDYNLIVTNNHVVQNNSEAVIGGKLFPQQMSTVFFNDPKYDISFIKPPDSIDFPDIKLGRSQPQDGDRVIAIGHPYGLNYTATEGIVSKAKRMYNGLNYIQIDAAINPGNSGGPLVNDTGEIIGVNTFIISGGNNLGFALPSNYLSESLEEYKDHIGSIAIRCPSCTNIVTEQNIDSEYCPFCGTKVILPVKKDTQEYKPVGISAVVEKIITEMGKNVKIARRGQNSWELQEDTTKIFINYAQNGFIVGDAFICKLPKSNISAIYEFLLRENYNLEFVEFCISRQDVLMSFLIYDQYLEPEVTKKIFTALFEKGKYYTKVLIEQYGCLPKVNDEE